MNETILIQNFSRDVPRSLLPFQANLARVKESISGICANFFKTIIIELHDYAIHQIQSFNNHI